MNAVDMFKQIGYEKIEFSQILIYINEGLREFVFILESKKLLVRQFDEKKLTYGEASITQDEYIAIYEQLKELGWLTSEYKEPILTNKEKIIIKNILKAFEPFDKEISYITKELWAYDENCCYLNFRYGDDNSCTLAFNQNKLFKGMELERKYTIEDLGL